MKEALDPGRMVVDLDGRGSGEGVVAGRWE